ncbi:MAG: DUF882 domain-containing protein [Vampirovibrionales bacterium]|nr:DUF882 domain-containing protein [Vampirovibrionales bacterium]
MEAFESASTSETSKIIEVIPTPLAVKPRNIQLTPDFNLAEFLRPQDPVPAPYVLDNLYRLANRLQLLRDLLGRPIRINSGYRTIAHNQEVGGVQNSQHLSGTAVDIVVPGLMPRDLQLILMNWSGGMGQYKTYTHLDIRPYRARWRG